MLVSCGGRVYLQGLFAGYFAGSRSRVLWDYGIIKNWCIWTLTYSSALAHPSHIPPTFMGRGVL